MIVLFALVLQDDEHQPVDLNDMHWSCCLCVYFSKENPRTPPVALGATNYEYRNGETPTGLLRDDIDKLLKQYKIGEVESRMTEEEKNNIVL